ncbi:MAG TPA: hypothetical protein VL988_00865 [Solirubrobacteraceae bacterium]|nr:hypothetical protein [Solirubrobacteraceae bacterium]
MRNGVETLDLVVRMGDGLSLTLGAASIDSERMLLVGALIDREVPMQIGMTISVVATGELLEGAHIERETEVALEFDGEETGFSWLVSAHDLGDGFALQDARVETEAGPLRAFAIEDLAFLAGAGLAVAVGAGLWWDKRKREGRIREDFGAKWRDCLERGWQPKLDCAIEDVIGLEANGTPRIRSGAGYSMSCVPPPDRG